MTHPAAEDIGPVTFAVLTGPDGVVSVAIGGDLDIASAPAVRERLLSLLRPGACRLVVDMSAVRYADASGLAVLASTQRRAVLLGGGLRLAAPRPEVAAALTATGLSRRLTAYPTVRAAAAGRKPGPPVMAAPARTAQAQAEPGAGHGELHAAVAALLADADAWRDADPRRRFSPSLRALAQAHAGNSHAALIQAARSLLVVLGREPLTYSPVVAATASRLRRLFPTGRRPATGSPAHLRARTMLTLARRGQPYSGAADPARRSTPLISELVSTDVAALEPRHPTPEVSLFVCSVH